MKRNTINWFGVAIGMVIMALSIFIAAIYSQSNDLYLTSGIVFCAFVFIAGIIHLKDQIKIL